MKIGDFNTEEKVLVIAEIGNNHEGDFALAKKMIRLASASGANAVKFQSVGTFGDFFIFNVAVLHHSTSQFPH